MARTVIDPVTRIEGHMRVECEVQDNKIVDAWVSGSLYRGMETVLLDRSPEDAFYVSQRICGVCPISHSHASAQATESALGIKIPEGGRLVRNLLEAAQFLHSHILWFYNLAALDYVNPVNALSANIADTYSLAQAAGTRPADFGAVAARLKAFVDNGQYSIFSGHLGWWGVGAEKHPGYALPPELDLIATAHYLEALEIQAVANEIVAIIAGKFSHPMTSVPGGTAFVPTVDKLDDILFRFVRVKEFIDTALIPDTLAIAPFILDAATYGGGTGNFLSWGVFEKSSLVPEERYLPRGFAQGLKLDASVSPDDVTEYTAHSWYESKTGLNPAKGETKVKFTNYSTDDKYSYGKAVRCKDKSTESGPLARMVVAYLSEAGGMDVAAGADVRTPAKLIDSTLAALNQTDPMVLVSLLGRVAARNLEAAYVADLALVWVNELVAALAGGEAKFWQAAEKDTGAGVGAWEAPRGSVAHWIGVEGGKINHYQIVAPTTWDIAPRDDNGVRGPLEEALVGAPVADPERPLEALRIAHSFDP